MRCKLDNCKVRDATLTQSELLKCDNDKCTLANSCVAIQCTFGPVLTTTNSEYESCTGNPFPPPEAKLCKDCNWDTGDNIEKTAEPPAAEDGVIEEEAELLPLIEE